MDSKKYILDKYNYHCNTDSDIFQHLPTIKKYADNCGHVTEFGVRGVVSTWALLAAFPQKVRSYDTQPPSNFGVDIKEVEKIAKESGIDFKFKLKSTLDIKIEPTALLLIDTLHTYKQLSQELKLHHDKVGKYIILHDTVSFGERGEDGGEGLLKAINEFIECSGWRILEKFQNNNGLMVLTK